MARSTAAAIVVCQCRSGVRSAKAAAFLRSAGFERVLNLTGGILRWSDEVDPDAAQILGGLT